MGKKSREKIARRNSGQNGEEIRAKEKESNSIFLKIIRWATYLILFTPLIVSGKYFFPFVGPKSLYFMALAQIIFFSWLLLIILNPKYRPKLNAVSIALILFLIVLVAGAFAGEDLSRSFWSKYERMTGLLMWFHLFAFFLAISTSFRKWADWSKIFSVSIFSAVLISAISLFIKAGANFLGSLTEASRGGATLGNTSFLGTYLLFNIFLALYMILKSKGNLKSFFIFSLPVMFLAVYLANARAATLSIIIGLSLLFLLYFIFVSQKRYLNILAKFALPGIAIIFLIVAFYVFQPDNFIHNWFVEKATYARLVVWEGGWQGFLEKPWLGWGPENFELVFTKHFDPCMFLGECGGEIWFDRAHNIVLDTLVSSGILGMIAFLGIFLSVFYVLWRPFIFKKEESGEASDFWTAGIFSTALIAYFIQNLTVFDMVSSYLMLFLVLGFVAHLAGFRPEPGAKPQISPVKQMVSAIILIFFIFSFFKFIIQPVQANKGVISVLRSQSPQERALLAEKTLETSSLGKYQIREAFVDRAISFSQSQEAMNFPAKDFEAEFEFLSQELEKSVKESPLDFKARLKLGGIYNLYFQINPAKLALAEGVLQKAIELSPTNQQGYWELAQTRLYQGEIQHALSLAEIALDLDKRVARSHLVVVQIAKFSGDQELTERKAREAIEIIPALEQDLRMILE